MTVLGAAGLVTLIALADRRVVALLMALIGLLISSWHQDKQQRASLGKAFWEILRDIAASSPGHASQPRGLPRRHTRLPRRTSAVRNRSNGAATGLDAPNLPGAIQHTKSSV